MIQLKNIVKYYTSDTSVTMALKNINLKFQKGEFVAITGKSGSGKSTLMNVISGMDSYEEGELYFHGQETSYFDEKDWEKYRKEKISFIYQSYQLIDSYTALENVEAVMSICEDGENRTLRKKRRKKAMKILEKVGLKKWARHRAVHLSSGQKQRLGIARALAKETDVIIADEPTGNLDVENGKAVMKMLYELSRDKLVLVVTHNYEQVEEYATRKIRLFDGEVAEDTVLRQIEKQPEPAEEKNTKKKKKQEKKWLQEWKKAIYFVGKNRKAQPHRSLFLFLILAFSIASFFVMYGYFLGSLDETKTREQKESAFYNTRDDRLVVRKMDGSVLSEKNLEELGAVKYVKYVNPYDYTSEISCLFEQNKDYQIEYKKTENSKRKSISITPLNYEHYLSNADGLEASDLWYGTVAKERNEVVLPSKDKSLVGTTMDLYFMSKSWAGNVYVSGEFVVTGLIDPEDTNVYLTGEYLSSLNINYADTSLQLDYTISRSDQDGENTQNQKKTKIVLIKGDGLQGNEIRVSDALTMNLNADTLLQEQLDAQAVIKDTDKEENSMTVEILEESHSGSMTVAEVSEECLEQFYGSTEITQASLVIEDYAYADRVIWKVNALGYQVISPYRVSAGEFVDEKVQTQMFTIAMSLGTILILFGISVLVMYAMMKLRRKDFVISKSLGLSQSIIEKMNGYELMTDSVFLVVLYVVIAQAADNLKIRQLTGLVKYYRTGDYVILAVLAVLLAAVTAKVFNHYLKKIMGGKR